MQIKRQDKKFEKSINSREIRNIILKRQCEIYFVFFVCLVFLDNVKMVKGHGKNNLNS